MSNDHRDSARPSLIRTLTSLLAVVSRAAPFGLLVGLLLVGFTLRGTVSTTPAGSLASSAAPGAGTIANIDIELGDLYIKPASISVAAGAKLVLNVTNKGSMDHNLGLNGKDPTLVKPGTSTSLDWGTIAASTTGWCTVPGHKDAGMVLKINAEGGSASADTAATTADDTAATSATIDANAKPAADWKPFDPTVKPADGATTHEETFHVKEQKTQVAPGVEQLLWTYNGTAPGPILRGKVGDLFTITLINDGTMNHSIDFHASKVAPNVEMRTIKPGESLTYQFKAQFAGIFTYHCGASPMIHHMGNGMFGAVIIDPPNLPPVDKEFVFVQSELNLGPNGEPSDLTKMMSGKNDGVVFNGYYNQYVHSPIKVNPGDRIRAWVVNAAINEDLAFHVVGSIFDTAWKEGAYTLRRGNAEQGGSQTLDLQPTQGGFVELTLETPGQYTFVNHRMMDLSRGAAGVFVVGDGGGGSEH